MTDPVALLDLTRLTRTIAEHVAALEAVACKLPDDLWI